MSDGGVAVSALASESWDQWFEIPTFYSEIFPEFFFSRCFFRQVYVLISVLICANVLKMHAKHFFIRFFSLQNTNFAFGPLLLLDETRRDVLYVKAGTP